MKFRTFRAGVGASTLDVDTVDLAPPEQSSEPPRLPSLDSHGLIPPSPCPTAADYLQPPNDPYLPRHAHNNQPFDKALLAPSNDRSQRASTSDSRSCDSRRGSFPTLAFTSAVPSSAGDFGDRTSSDKRRELSEATANEEARRKRIAISRQLRLLFIYPIMYALMWVPPLILHAMQFTDRYMQNPSYPLYCVVAFTLPFQCFVDCWLFTIREKPWRYIPETQDGNWYARYGFGFGKCKGRSAEIGAEEGGDAAWRNRKHMSFEAKKAYERRDAETHEAAEEWLRRDQPRSSTTQRGERSWWDVEEQGIEGELAELEEEDGDTTPRGGRSLDDLPRLKIDTEIDGNVTSNAA
jgi:G protein-coupled receptor GPR1